MSSRRTLIPAALACLVTAAALTPAAEAQQPKQKGEEAVRMPSPRRSDEPPTLFAYFIVALSLGVVFGANMIPSKRGHQD